VFAALAAAALLTLVPQAAEAQRRGGRGRSMEAEANAVYDGRFTFARIRYEDGVSGPPIISQQIPWSHDYPSGERNFTKILQALSTMRVRTTESVILKLNDPELFKYPIAYMSEPGFWQPNDAEIAGMRAYIQKGGFVIFDDFQGPSHFYNLESQLRRVLPGSQLLPVPPSHPVFDSFYKIADFSILGRPYGVEPEYWGIFEDNDPTKKLLMIANHNNDLSEFWEYADTGFAPIEVTNESFKLGINYIIYALTR
jgi:hypothetical protein